MAERIQDRFETRRGHFMLRPYAPEDEPGVLKLWEAAFFKPLAPELWRWKYMDNPFGHQISLCTDATGSVLAVYSGIPYRGRWKDTAVRLTQLMDIMSHPDYRGEGLFLRAARAFFQWYGPPDGSVCLYGFPGELHFKIGKRLLKYRATSETTGYLTAVPTRSIRLNLFRGRIERLNASDDRLDGLARQVAARFPFSLIRDRAFVDWRFFRHPVSKYEVWGYRPLIGKHLRGYAALREQGGRLALVDLVMPEARGQATDFIHRLMAMLASRHASMVETWLPPSHEAVAKLIDAGFVPQTEPLGIIPTVKILDSGLTAEWISKHIYYTIADADLR